MADSKRLRVLKALSALLDGITVADGYQHDLAGKVFRGRKEYGSGAPLPMLSILEYVRPDNQEDVASENTARDRWPLLVQGWTVDDYENPTDPGHNLMADVKKRLALIRDDDSPHYRLGGLIVDISMNGGLVYPPSEVSTKAQFFLRVFITLVENVADPYA